MKFTPRPYQEEIIDHILRHPRCAVFAGMGMGKTSSTLFALDFIKDVFGETPALVLAPLRVAQSTWPDEVRKWSELSGLRVSPIIGDAKTRAAAVDTKADIYTCNYENLPWLVNYLAKTRKSWPFPTIVADESTRLKGHRARGGGVRTRALAAVAFAAKRFIALTGTPAPNGIQDLWGQFWFLDKGARLCESYSRFEQRWFKVVQVGADAFAVKLVPYDWSQKDIQDRIKDISITVKAEDHFPIKDPIVTNVAVELPPDARKLYEKLKREAYAELEDGAAVEAFNAAAVTMKCLQVASGVLYDEDRVAHDVHDAKLDALASIVEESAGAPVLVAYHWKADVARIKKRFPYARELDKNPNTIREWNAGKIPMLLAHPASAGHGLNLQDGGNILVFYSHWWDLEARMQIIERIGPTRQHQAGHNRPVFIYNIVAKRTMDETVISRVETKRSVQEVLLDAMKKEQKHD